MTAKGSTGVEVLLSTLEVKSLTDFNYVAINTSLYWGKKNMKYKILS